MYRIRSENNEFYFKVTLTGQQVVDLAIVWLLKPENAKVAYDQLNSVYLRNIARATLMEHGTKILDNLPAEVYLKRQEVLIQVKGYVEV